jgi:charged multivesicular body protein 2A
MSFIAKLFHRKTPEEMMREYKRSLDKTCRELDKERSKLMQQEKKIQIEMKKMAKQDQMDALRVMARDLIRTRNYAQKFYRMKAQVQAVSLRLQTMTSTNQMARAMKGVTQCMSKMNQKMNVPAMQRIMQDFERQNEMMGMKEEMMNEAIDEVMDFEENEEEETEELVNKIMDEVTMDFREKVGVADSAIGQPAPAMQQETEEDKALEARLAALKTAMK